MRIDVIQIGNSKGIRLPKTILRQCNIGEKLDAEIKENNIILKPVKKAVRKDWDKQFSTMRNNREDKLLITEQLDLKSDDWTW